MITAEFKLLTNRIQYTFLWRWKCYPSLLSNMAAIIYMWLVKCLKFSYCDERAGVLILLNINLNSHKRPGTIILNSTGLRLYFSLFPRPYGTKVKTCLTCYFLSVNGIAVHQSNNIQMLCDVLGFILKWKEHDLWIKHTWLQIGHLHFLAIWP